VLTWHASRSLARYADGDLPAGEARRVDDHLASCARCRTELEEIRFASGLLRQLTIVPAPASVWSSIEAASEQPGVPAFPMLQWAMAAALTLALVGGAGYWWTRTPGPWEVAADGSRTRLAVGDWVEPRETAARIRVGDIGTVDVAPGARVRLGTAGQDGYRLALAHGTISAQISAPPRLFIVDTPASTLVDLGCAYTVTMAEDGTGELHMTQGWAALEWKGRETLVPAGAMSRTRPVIGPGMPYFEDASSALKRAVDDFDTNGWSAAAMNAILREARARDTLTLWHLLSRVPEPDRGLVYDRLSALVAPPASVNRTLAIALDPDTLRMLREELAWHW
jgi:anti-sigma factor RsiW